jgi:aspartyl-tRNA(Asn)/glutamyl-tRNA(Gln) amidotransferase subunit A
MPRVAATTAAEPWRLSAAQLTAAFRAGHLTPSAALESCLARADAWQPRINAFVTMDTERARAAAWASDMRWRDGRPRSRIDGVPVTVKDNLHVAGMPTRWGSRLTSEENAPRDEAPVARWRAAGAVIFAKTNTPEFAMEGVTENDLVGPTRNPWDPRLTPGGSSGGAAAAVAAGCGALALATDGGGSIRRPADHCGVAGFKPSRGVVLRHGGLPPMFLDHEVVGPMARNVADLALGMEALGMEALAAPSALAPGIRTILMTTRFGDHPVDARVARMVGHAGEAFRSIGVTIVERPSLDIADEINALWPQLSAAGLAWLVDQWDHAQGPKPDLEALGPVASAALARGTTMPASELFAVFAAVSRLEHALASLFAEADAFLLPNVAALAWPIGLKYPPEIDGRSVGSRGHAVFTALANAAGLPALALPVGVVDGLPVGAQIVGRHGADRAVLDLGLCLERALGLPPRFPDDESDIHA